MIVYKVTNLINGKIYVGMTKRSLEERKKDHLKTINQPSRNHLHFYRALKKYGFYGFKWEILEHCLNEKDMSDKEVAAIRIYESCNPNKGYNLSPGGKGGDIFANNPNKKEICEKLSKAHLGKHVSEEVKDRIRKKLKGRKLSLKQIEDMKKRNKGMGLGRKMPQHVKDKIGASNKGKHFFKFGRPSKELIERRKRIGTASKIYKHLSNELKNKILDLYKVGNSLADISAIVNLSRTKVRKTLKENSVLLRASRFQKGHKSFKKAKI